MSEDAKTPEEIVAEAKAKEVADAKAIEDAKPKGYVPDGWSDMDDVQKLAAVSKERDAKLSANSESKERRLKLQKYEDADEKAADAKLEAVELLAKRDKEIGDLKTEITNMGIATKHATASQGVTATLVEKGFKSDLINLVIKDADLTTDDGCSDFVKEFSKTYKDYAVKATDTKPKPEKVNPFALAQPPAEKGLEGLKGRNANEKEFTQTFAPRTAKK